MVAAAVGVGAVVGGVASSAMSSNAASKAANSQQAAAQAGIDEQDKQFQQVQQLLSPYVNAGNGALTAQQNLIGLNGSSAQQDAINQLQQNPAYTSALAAGNRNILSNASATGGLRGGNTQAALGQYAPQLLAQMIQQQYSNLGGLSSLGQNAAAGVGNAGMQTGNNVTGLLGQIGASQAGNSLAQGAAGSGILNSFTNGLGAYSALGGFNSSSSATPAIVSGSNPSGYGGTLNNPSAFVAGGF